MAKNRFSGADNVYVTKNYYVRQDVCSDARGKLSIEKRYIPKTPASTREYRAVFGPAVYDRRGFRK